MKKGNAKSKKAHSAQATRFQSCSHVKFVHNSDKETNGRLMVSVINHFSVLLCFDVNDKIFFMSIFNVLTVCSFIQNTNPFFICTGK